MNKLINFFINYKYIFILQSSAYLYILCDRGRREIFPLTLRILQYDSDYHYVPRLGLCKRTIIAIKNKFPKHPFCKS